MPPGPTWIKRTAALTAVIAGLTGEPSGSPVSLVTVGSAMAQQTEGDGTGTVPQRHFRIEQPAELSGSDALSLYQRILDDVVAGYRLSGDAVARDYRTWQRYNSAPYRSATHGERFVNNYANARGAAYGRYEDSGSLPPGAIMAKDSFAVTASGDVFTGPLFLMEKMDAGFNPPSRDWRYTMIMPDGSLFGTTGGQGDERVTFCITCHAGAGDDQDHLFYVPEDYRLPAPQLE